MQQSSVITGSLCPKKYGQRSAVAAAVLNKIKFYVRKQNITGRLLD